jgi:hypothetical protein
MKKLLLLVGILVAMSSLSWAGACGDASISTYDVSGFNCTIDGLTFSNFGFTSGALGGALAPAVNVIACPGGGAFCSDLPTGEYGFVFQVVGGIATSGQSVDAGITYTVSGDIVDALALTAGGSTGGTGSITVSETSLGGLINLNVPNGNGSDTQTFAPVSTLTVTKDIAVSGGTDGNAQLSFVANGWSTVPEPSTLGFLLVGSLGLLGYAGRRQKKVTE